MKAIKETDLRDDLTNIPDRNTEDRIYILCPGCFEQAKIDYPDREEECWWLLSSIHCLNIKVHTFNGNYENPTFTPSLLSTYTVDNIITECCHSYVTNGNIQYLPDCTHPLVNKTVPLIEFHVEDRDNHKVMVRDLE